MTDAKVEQVKMAIKLHDLYEKSAEEAGWNTQKKCKVEFHDLPVKNQIVMLVMADFVLKQKAEAKKEERDRIIELLVKEEKGEGQDIAFWHFKDLFKEAENEDI